MSAPLSVRQPRATLSGTVQVNVGRNCLVGELCTLSAGGVLIAGLPTLSPGTRASLFVLLPRSQRPVVSDARVLYDLPGGAIGFAFVALPSDERDRLSRAIDGAATIYLTLETTLRFAPERREDIDALCRQVGIAAGLPVPVLRPRVDLALKRLQLGEAGVVGSVAVIAEKGTPRA